MKPTQEMTVEELMSVPKEKDFDSVMELARRLSAMTAKRDKLLEFVQENGPKVKDCKIMSEGEWNQKLHPEWQRILDETKGE